MDVAVYIIDVCDGSQVHAGTIEALKCALGPNTVPAVKLTVCSEISTCRVAGIVHIRNERIGVAIIIDHLNWHRPLR